MLGWFKKQSAALLATPGEREAILRGQHPLFRQVDTGFHLYMEVLSGNPEWTDDQIEHELLRRGVEAGLAEDLVVFSPIAFGREVVQQLGVACSDVYRLHNLTDGSERELPLTNELAFVWAKAMIGLYRTAERNEVFKLLATRSAELGAVSNALSSGVPVEELRSGKLAPSIINVRRRASSGMIEK